MADILNGNPPQAAAAADLEQVQALAAAVLDGRLGDEGRGTLERLVVRHQATARQDLRSADLDGDGRQISATVRAADALAGRFVLHATVDRTGFDPATVRASASAAADDQVNGVLVNGVLVNGVSVNGVLVNGVSVNGVRAAVGAGLASRCAERHGFPSPGRWHAGVSDVDALGDDSPGRHSTNRAS